MICIGKTKCTSRKGLLNAFLWVKPLLSFSVSRDGDNETLFGLQRIHVQLFILIFFMSFLNSSSAGMLARAEYRSGFGHVFLLNFDGFFRLLNFGFRSGRNFIARFPLNASFLLFLMVRRFSRRFLIAGNVVILLHFRL